MVTPPQGNATLLVVDDDPDVAEMLNAYFSVLGYKVIAVNFGEDALAECAKQVPDLVILDIHLLPSPSGCVLPVIRRIFPLSS
ncbi:MAG: response regulator [Anaerolineales bacterium]